MLKTSEQGIHAKKSKRTGWFDEQHTASPPPVDINPLKINGRGEQEIGLLCLDKRPFRMYFSLYNKFPSSTGIYPNKQKSTSVFFVKSINQNSYD